MSDTKPRLFEVGGCVRDDMLGIPSKDIDFAVEGFNSLDDMATWLEADGFDIFKVDTHTFTLRARFPKTDSNKRYKGLAADFVMCRREGPYSDLRHPDWVEPGDLNDDLSRRDFTVNAIAREIETGSVFDPFEGQQDLRQRCLRFVGDPRQRILEDPLRILRGLRFMITRDLSPTVDTALAMFSDEALELLGDNDIIPIERVHDEVRKMFEHDTHGTGDLLFRQIPRQMRKAIFRDGLWLTPTLKAI